MAPPITLVRKTNDVATALEVIDDLRARVVSGEVVAFAVVGVAPNDGTSVWASCTQHVTRLRMMGAIHQLLHCYTVGEVDD